MSKDKTIILLSVIIIVFIIIICSVLIYFINTYYNSDYQETDFENRVLYEAVKDIQLLDNKNKYFVIEKIGASLVSHIKQINGDIESDTINTNKDEAKETSIKIITDMLDFQYKKEMNTIEEDIVNLAKEYNDYTYILDKIYVCDKSANIDIFIVYAYLGNKEFNIIVKTDSENETFSIFLNDYVKKYDYDEKNKLKDINTISEDNIQENKYNKFAYTNIKDKEIAEYYFTNYINMVKYQSKNAYELLDEEYKNKRFPTYNDFQQYVNKIKQQEIIFDSYEIIKSDDYALYVCKDERGFSYIFKASGVAKYTVQLDEYTMQSEELVNTYKNMSQVDKCNSNIKTIFEMINMKDYASVYEKLNNAFRINNFNTLEQFETYANNAFFDYNIIGQITIEEQGANYVIKVPYKDGASSEEEKRTQLFVMRLLEGTEFEISFQID